MMYDKEIETRPVEEQFSLDRESYRKQVSYLFERSAFYQLKLKAAGFHGPAEVGRLDDIANLPFTEKDELRVTQATSPPFGDYLACAPGALLKDLQYQWHDQRTLPPGPDSQGPGYLCDKCSPWIHRCRFFERATYRCRF